MTEADQPTHGCENCSATFTTELAKQLQGICPECKYSILLAKAFPDHFKNKTVVESANPDHYKTETIECIDAMRAMLGEKDFSAYLRGTIFKYNWRMGKKDACKIETEKISVYVKWLLDVLSGTELRK